MRRLTPLLVLLAAVLAFPAVASAAATFGISDQQAGTFSNPLFAPLKSKVARYITPYDVMSDEPQRERLDAWVKGATAARQRILISFEHSRREGREGRLPSVGEYTRFYGVARRHLRGGTLVMHPGPVNRGVEIGGDVVLDAASLVPNQVAAGVPVRSAVLTVATGAAQRVAA